MVLALWFYLLALGGHHAGWPGPFNDVLLYLVWLNFLLAGFNLIPAFPLDGGRVLRSILWSVKGNIRWATRIASQLGAAFGIFLIVMGIFNILRGNFIGGIWWCLIGMFLRGASQMSYQQLLMRRALKGEAVRRFMQAEPITVPPSVSVQDLVEDYFYKYHFKMFPVVQDGRLIGCVTSRDVKQVPRHEWTHHTVAEVARQCEDNTIGPEVDAMNALATMHRTGNSRLMVVEGDRLLGIIALKDMLKFLSLKFDLEGDEE